MLGAFDLPPVDRCLVHRTVSFQAEADQVSARVDGRPFKRIEHAGTTVRLRFLPRGRHELELTAGQRTVRRPYQTCIDTRPGIAAPTGDAPTTLQQRDLVEGSIRRARRGHRVAVQYTTMTWSEGKIVDSSWDRSRDPFTFRLGSGVVIEGFDRGIRGMKIGGRRELIVPPALAYGDAGSGPIKANETIVFVIDLVAIG